MEQLHTRRPRRFARLAGVATLAAVTSTCTAMGLRYPGPAFASPDSVSREEFLRYARSIEFIGVGAGHHLGDEQPMSYAVRDPRNAAIDATTAMARVEPDAHGERLTRRDAGRGRAIGRVLSTGRYEPLGIHPGVSYLWVDSTTARGWRGLIVSEDPANPIATLRVAIEPGSHRVPAASWIYSVARGIVPWINIDDICVEFFPPAGPFSASLRAELLTPDKVRRVPR